MEEIPDFIPDSLTSQMQGSCSQVCLVCAVYSSVCIDMCCCCALVSTTSTQCKLLPFIVSSLSGASRYLVLVGLSKLKPKLACFIQLNLCLSQTYGLNMDFKLCVLKKNLPKPGLFLHQQGLSVPDHYSKAKLLAPCCLPSL